jgi:hypothetical protein
VLERPQSAHFHSHLPTQSCSGCHGIIISNHGGRQLDSCLSSIEALPAIAHALRQRGFLIDADLRAGVSRFQSADRKGKESTHSSIKHTINYTHLLLSPFFLLLFLPF